MRDDIFADDFSEDPWWWREAPPAEGPMDGLSDDVDAVVVGSGYSGLSCALELGRAGMTVLVIDALRIGQGASTRNAGFTSGRAGVGKQINLPAAVGAEKAAAILDEAHEAHEFLRQRFEAEKIDAGYEYKGRFVGAHSPAAYKKLQGKIAEHNSVGALVYEDVPLSRRDDYVRSTYYHGGLFIPDAGTIHPARYHRGLRLACAAAGVRFAPNTRVLGIVDEEGGKRVMTEKGAVRARHVALGVGGYVDAAAPWQRRRVIPMSSTLIATEPLDPDLVRHLLPAGCPVIDAKRVLNLARPAPDGRTILFGGRAKFSPIGARESTELLYGQMVDMFPELKGVKVVNAWAGLMGFSFDWLPKVGVHDGVHYAMCCNGGAGIVMMSWLGRHMGRTIAGTTNRVSAFEGLPFQSRPLYNGNPWFVPFIGRYYKFRDWLDMRGVKRAA
jgi:glycine/D-amino acid oxidase-like deaminating enzyme